MLHKKNSRVNLALIGVGRWGKNYVSTIDSLNHVRLSYAVTSNLNNKYLLPKNCILLDDWKRVFEKENIDGVIVATPANLNAKIALAALNAGLPVMIEKPLALNVEDAVSIQEMVLKSGLTILVDHTYLFHSAYDQIKKVLVKKNEIVSIKSMAWNWGPFRKEVDPLWDYAPHDLAMCLDLLGEFPEHFEVDEVESVKTPNGIGKMFNIKLKFPTGVVAQILVGNMRSPKKRYFEVKLKNKEIIFDDLFKYKLIVRSADENIPVNFIGEAPLRTAVKTFVKGINGKNDARLGADLSVNVIRILNEVDLLLK